MPQTTTNKNNISIPYKFTPRDYQLPLLQALDSGYTRACVRWHRRAGKDKLLINLMAKKALERTGIYFYIYPFYSQARKALWENIDKDGMRFMDHLPEAIRTRTNNQEMMIELINGSIIRIIGSDNPDSVVGTNPVGVVFSEYALQDPTAWYFLRPILAENGGWAVFNSTPRGANHFKDLWQLAERDPDFWYTQKLGVSDTKAIPDKVLARERAEYLEQTGSDDLYMQEYEVSFEAAVQGSYYGGQMLKAERDGRITNVPWETELPVHTYWDLGMDDSMTIWFLQVVGNELRIIDYMEHNGEGIAYYAKELRALPYVYGEHWAPHDIEVRELGTGKSRLETAKSLGISFRVTPNLSLEDGIDAARKIIAKCWFDKTKCEKGINALRSYAKEWDEKNKVYKNRPRHDWASHGADAFRYLAVAYRPVPKPLKIPTPNLWDKNGFF